MRKYVINNILILFVILVVGCKKTEAKLDSQPIEQAKSNDTISLDSVNQFDEIDEGNKYVLSNYKFIYNTVNNEFTLNEGTKLLGTIDFEKKEFDGSGYNIFLYGSNESRFKFIIFEALADIGTAWYYVVILEKDKISNSFFINEPRSNSDNISLTDYLSIQITDQDCVLKFLKKEIASYSSIPKELKADNKFIYLKKALREDQNQLHKVNNEWDGHYKIELLDFFKENQVHSFILTIDIKGEQANLNFLINGKKIKRNIKGKINKNNYTIEYLENDQDEQYIITKENNKFYISGSSIYLLNPPNEKYVLEK